MDNADTEAVRLDLTSETVPEPTEDTSDPAAEAFARLEGEMALMRRAVQHLASERADIVNPDYGKTLAAMAKRLGEIDNWLRDMSQHPAMRLTPDSIGNRIAAAAESARRANQDRINQARDDLHQAAQDMRSVTVHARTAAEQRQKLIQVAVGGLLAGILLWSFLPGTIARAVPESWHWPERMAARMVGQDDPWNAGIRMMQADRPARWDAIVRASRIEQENRELIEKCIKNADTSRHSVRCSLSVSPTVN